METSFFGLYTTGRVLATSTRLFGRCTHRVYTLPSAVAIPTPPTPPPQPNKPQHPHLTSPPEIPLKKQSPRQNHNLQSVKHKSLIGARPPYEPEPEPTSGKG